MVQRSADDTDGPLTLARLLRNSAALCAVVSSVDAGCVARLRETSDVIDLDYPLFFVDRVEDAVPVGSQAPQVRRPVSERLRWPRLTGKPANALPECSDTSGIVAEEVHCLVESLDLPVDLVAHREDMPRRRPASSWET